MALSDAHFLAVAHIIADAGTCSRLKVGAVLVKDRRIISTGYNGAPSGVPHCFHPEPIVNTTLEGRRLIEVGSGSCTRAIHAEVNAIAFAARNGVSTDGSVLYTTDSPCENCARLVINAGVREVKYGKQFRDLRGLSILSEVGIRTEELGEPLLRLVRVVGGDKSGLHTSESSDQAFDEGWSAYSDSRRGRGSGGE